MKKAKILIIDDDFLLSKLLANSLRPEFSVEVANDAYQALSSLEREVPDLIILDILLPALNGLGFLNDLRSYADTAKVPVIICSSIAEGLNQDLMRASGVVKILDKTTMQPSDIKAYAKQALGAYE